MSSNGKIDYNIKWWKHLKLLYKCSNCNSRNYLLAVSGSPPAQPEQPGFYFLSLCCLNLIAINNNGNGGNNSNNSNNSNNGSNGNNQKSDALDDGVDADADISDEDDLTLTQIDSGSTPESCPPRPKPAGLFPNVRQMQS